MIPILYEAGTTTFTTQGLGRLNDAISCRVTEERNGVYELELEYPVDGLHWDDVAISRIILAKPNETSDPQAFRIYKIEKPFNRRCMVYAEHISYQLSYIPVMPFTADSFSDALNKLRTNAAESCPFTVWTDKTATGDYTLKTPASFRALLGGAEHSLLDVYGKAEYEFDNYTIKAHLNRGSNNGVVLRYGKNITDLAQEESIENTITGICPYWQNPESGETVTLTASGYGSEVIYSENHTNFPYERTVPMDFSANFEEPPTEAQLAAAASSYITANGIGVPEVSLTVSFIPLWQSEEYADLAAVEHVSLCDTITVYFEALDVSASAKVVKTTYDVLRERYESIEIGDPHTTLAKQIASIGQAVETQADETTSILAAAITAATEKIVGGKGGYVKFNYNANGEPEEILIMSAPTEAASQKIIRMNMAGIGFSTDYGVTYRTAWTIDGHFVADFIDTGTLTANLLKAGVIQAVNGSDYWNLQTGEMVLDGGHIQTGTIDASQATITNINASNITSGYLSADRINAGTLAIGKLDTSTQGQIANGVTAYNRATSYRGTCATTAGDSAKVVACTNFVLEAGASITVYFTYSNTTAGALTLKVGTSDPQNVYVAGAVTSDTNRLLWTAGASITFIYDGTQWQVEDNPGVWYCSTCTTAEDTADKTAAASQIVLFKGTTVYVPMTNANTQSSPTLNVGGLGASSIYYASTTTGPTTANGHGWIAGRTVEFQYDGKFWRLAEYGTLIQGNHISTGIISDSTGQNYWNLETGEIHAESAIISTVTSLTDAGTRNLLADTNAPTLAAVAAGARRTFENYNTSWLNAAGTAWVPLTGDRVVRLARRNTSDGITRIGCDEAKFLAALDEVSSASYTLDKTEGYFQYASGDWYLWVKIASTSNYAQISSVDLDDFGIALLSSSLTDNTSSFGFFVEAGVGTPTPEILYGARFGCTDNNNDTLHHLSFYAGAYPYLKADTPYTFSFWAMTDTASTQVSVLTCEIEEDDWGEWDGESHIIYIEGDDTTLGTVTLPAANTWNRYSLTITPSEDLYYAFRVGPTHNVSGMTWLCGFKLEEGDIAQGDWTPAPEDAVSLGLVQSTIEQYADTIRLKANNIVWESDHSSMTADGTLTCEAGSVGGWDITSDRLNKYVVQTVNGVQYQYEIGMFSDAGSPTNAAFGVRRRTYDGTTYGTWGWLYYLRYDGKLYAQNAEIQGDLNAGSVGGWDITSDRINKYVVQTVGGVQYQYEIGMYSDSSSPTNIAFGVRRRTYDGTTYGTWEWLYYVRYDGRLYAKDADIQGNLNTGTIGTSLEVTTDSLRYYGGTNTAVLFFPTDWAAINSSDKDNYSHYAEMGFERPVTATLQRYDPSSGTNSSATIYGCCRLMRSFYKSSGSWIEATDFTIGFDFSGGFNCYALYSGAVYSSQVWTAAVITYSNTSDRRKKKDFADDAHTTYADVFWRLKPVSFRLKTGDTRRRIGLVAQDVIEALEEAGIDPEDSAIVEKVYPNKDSDEWFYTLDYHQIAAMAVAVVQDQKKTIESLEARLSAIEKRLGMGEN